MKLEKKLSFLGVFSIATGAMISSGIFILPGLAFSLTGPSVFISYTLAGLLGLLGILSVIELSTAMPKAGGDYFFINKTFGPMFGSISGLLSWIALSLKSAFAIFGLSEVVFIYSGVDIRISALVFTIFFVLLNIKGVEEAVTFQIILVIGLLSIMIIFIIYGIPNIRKENFNPFLTGGVNDVLVTSGFIFISFGGLLNVANLSEEMKNPKVNIPLGMLASIIVVTIIYGLITFVLAGTLSAESFKSSLTPVADSAGIVMGSWGYYIILLASVLAFFTTANAGIMSASRYPIALSRDRLLPKKLKTPLYAIILTGLLIYFSLLLPLEYLVKSASTVILTSYVLTNISVIILRESGLTNYKPSFTTPFYPFIQILCIVIFSFFIIDMGKDAIEISLGLIFVSFCVFIFYGRRVENRESAVLYLLKRLTENKLDDQLMEDELRSILIERDNIEQDSFDDLISRSEVIDIDENLTFEELIKRVSKGISLEFNIPRTQLVQEYLKRESESSTAVSEFVAIPHIVIPGSDKLFLKVVRAGKGIEFSESHNSVKAVFILGATSEKRVLHLKTLASIATLVQFKQFKEKWLTLDSTVELKNLMLLSNRLRFK